MYEIAERYNTSYPVSGDWETETAHEQQAIADEFGISLDDAMHIMIDILGFDPDDFREDVIEKSIEASSEYFYDSQPLDEYWYFTTHGVMPGSVPKGIQILDVIDKPEGSYFLSDKLLTPEALNYFDIKERSPF